MEQHVSGGVGVQGEKRHFFDIPNPHCNLDLEEYEYEDDFEWAGRSPTPTPIVTVATTEAAQGGRQPGQAKGKQAN